MEWYPALVAERLILVPTLKWDGLDSTDSANFRPIAHVSFLSKVIVKIAAYQLVTYLKSSNNLLPNPVWFSERHSTLPLLRHLWGHR